MSDTATPSLVTQLRLASLAAELRDSPGAVEKWIGRIEGRFGAVEGEVHSFLEEPDRFRRLRHEARPFVRSGPLALANVPVGVKDIFHVSGFETRAGSRLPPAVLAGEESQAVGRLRRAGILVLGKTVTTEFAYFAPGPTRNPWNTSHTPGGSSSGSAAAVAAGLCPLTLGTQTIGSIIRPAAFCGVVGFKPTYGRIPRDGVIPLAPSLDHVGFFVADVEGALLAASALLDGWDAGQRGGHLTIGVPTGDYLGRASPEALRAFEAARGRLAAAGYRVKPVPAFHDFAEVLARHERILAAQAGRVHRDWFSRYADLYHPRTAALIRSGLKIADEDLESALEESREWRDRLLRLMAAEGIGAWISPASTSTAPHGLDSTGDPVMNLPWTQAGLPTVCVPSGTGPGGLPLGLQITGLPDRDEQLLQWAKEIEALLKGPQP